MAHNRFPEGKKRNRILFILLFFNFLSSIYLHRTTTELDHTLIMIVFIGTAYTAGLFTDLREGL